MTTEEIIQPAASTHRRVIVIDDSLTVRKVIRKVVDGVGIEVTECATSAEGLAAVSQHFYDLIFLDYILPDATAAEFLDELLKNTDYAHVPVVLMSSKGAEIERLSDFKSNVAKALTKPFPGDEIRSILKDTFNASSHEGGFDAVQDNDRVVPKKTAASRARIILEREMRRVAKHIPSLETARGDRSARQYYLPFLMNPSLLRSVEKYEESLIRDNSGKTYPELSGKLEEDACVKLVRYISEGKKTGRLDLSADGNSLSLYVHKGSVLGIGTKSVEAYIGVLDPGLKDAIGSNLGAAMAQQEEDGCPLVLQLGSGIIDDASKEAVFAESSKELVGKFLSRPCSYRFWGDELAPDWVISKSLNLDIAGFFISSLRRIRGWGIIGEELGDLVTRFGHRYAVPQNWCHPFLNSFEMVVFDYLRFDFSVTELSHALGENPSRVAESIHLLLKMGLIEKAAQPIRKIIREQMYEEANVLLITSNEGLAAAIAHYAESHSVRLTHCKTGMHAFNEVNSSLPAVLIDDGTGMDRMGFGAAEKISNLSPDAVCVLAESTDAELSASQAIDLNTFKVISAPYKAANIKAIMDAAVLEYYRRFEESSPSVNELESINSRIAAREAHLNSIEKELQQREHELLRNEEVFFEKCNRFEEERTRLEIMQDEFPN